MQNVAGNQRLPNSSLASFYCTIEGRVADGCHSIDLKIASGRLAAIFNRQPDVVSAKTFRRGDLFGLEVRCFKPGMSIDFSGALLTGHKSPRLDRIPENCDKRRGRNRCIGWSCETCP